MERIQFYVPDGGSPKGKNYIFFAAHPKDTEQYFPTMQREIFKIEQNCTFWFDAEPEQIWNDSLTDNLDHTGMQLFIFPVTSQLLSTENNAITVLLPYALDKHIPVIPILMEPGLEALYQKTFGDLQYLDKAAVDVTAIPYEEKLKNHLQNILVNKETAEKIRAAFDAYIFLSYRKKDRALAAKLMKLIHEIPQMRDVAIWYDEFLVPGENFNANIADALEKSDLFAMAVTPNLVNEDNYVRKEEYPKAQASGKPILAVQVEDTDPVTFHECFEKLTGSIDAYDAQLLQQAFLGAFGKLRHITLAQNDDPMHTYLIGLAYLNGIDVERDYDRALKLITAAAEKECPDAMEELAKMYFDANGVKRDFSRAVEWQKKAVAWWRTQCQTEPSFITRLHLADQLARLGSLLLERKLLQEASQAYSEAIDQYTFCTEEKALAAQAQRSRIEVLELLAVTYTNNNDFPSARMAAFQIIEELTCVSPENLDIAQLGRLARAYVDAAFAEEQLGNTKAAENLYKKSLMAAQDFHVGDAPKAYAHLGLGKLYLNQQMSKEAQMHLNEAININKTLIQNANIIDYWESLFKANLLLGDLYISNGQFKEGKAVLQNALTIMTELSQKTGMMQMQCNIGICYNHLGVLYSGWDKLNRAESCYLASLHIFKELAQRTNSEVYLQHLAAAYASLGEIYCDRKIWDRADMHYLEAERIFHNIENQIECGKGLATTYGKHSKVFLETNNYRKAKQYLNEARSCAAKLLENGDFPEMRRLLSDVYRGLGIVYLHWSNPSSARNCLQKSLEIAQALPFTVENSEYLAECCDCLFQLHDKSNETALANQYRMKARMYREKAVQSRKE